MGSPRSTSQGTNAPHAPISLQPSLVPSSPTTVGRRQLAAAAAPHQAPPLPSAPLPRSAALSLPRCGPTRPRPTPTSRGGAAVGSGYDPPVGGAARPPPSALAGPSGCAGPSRAGRLRRGLPGEGKGPGPGRGGAMGKRDNRVVSNARGRQRGPGCRPPPDSAAVPGRPQRCGGRAGGGRGGPDRPGPRLRPPGEGSGEPLAGRAGPPSLCSQRRPGGCGVGGSEQLGAPAAELRVAGREVQGVRGAGSGQRLGGCGARGAGA